MLTKDRELARQRKRETLEYLWTCYAKNRADAALRDRLVEHYTPLVQEIAGRYIQRYRLRDGAAAIGDALLMLVVKLVPRTTAAATSAAGPRSASVKRCASGGGWKKGRSSSSARSRAARTSGPKSRPSWSAPRSLAATPALPSLVAAVSARDAAMLWLRFYRHLTPRQIAYALNLGPIAVAKQIARALGVLRKLAKESA